MGLVGLRSQSITPGVHPICEIVIAFLGVHSHTFDQTGRHSHRRTVAPYSRHAKAFLLLMADFFCEDDYTVYSKFRVFSCPSRQTDFPHGNTNTRQIYILRYPVGGHQFETEERDESRI
jgi:hypothetical protein